jgi:hypothetical protein
LTRKTNVKVADAMAKALVASTTARLAVRQRNASQPTASTAFVATIFAMAFARRARVPRTADWVTARVGTSLRIPIPTMNASTYFNAMARKRAVCPMERPVRFPRRASRVIALMAFAAIPDEAKARQTIAKLAT